MDTDDRTWSTSEIRERRREDERRIALDERRLALRQRRLAVLARIDEATEEFELIEREMEALDQPAETVNPGQTAETANAAAETADTAETASSGRADETFSPDPPAEIVSPEPHTIGERSKLILREHAGTWLIAREILAEMSKRGWVDTELEVAMQRLRHALRRVANNPDFERDETGTTFRYRCLPRADGIAVTPVLHPNGASYPGLQGTLSGD